MTSRDFCYWLQGYLELSGECMMTAGQVECVARHLALVFKHEIDPSMGDKKHQDTLNKTHAQIGGDGPDGTKYRC
jgi:hypothetical protein